MEWPIPDIVKALRRLLGLYRYYMRFVSKYAQLAAQLTELLWKDAFVWTPTATQAFRDLQQAMTKMTVLQLPDFFHPCVIQTDASGSRVGAILLQRRHPLAYFSKQLTPHLQASSTYTREMFTMTESVGSLYKRITRAYDLYSIRLFKRWINRVGFANWWDMTSTSNTSPECWMALPMLCLGSVEFLVMLCSRSVNHN